VYRVHIEPALSRFPLEIINRRLIKGAPMRMLDRGVTSQAVRAQAVRAQAVPGGRAAKRRDGADVQIGWPMHIAIQLAFVLLQRRSEVLGMAKAELDLSQRLWTIPAERMKGKRTQGPSI
jgi:integrase